MTKYLNQIIKSFTNISAIALFVLLASVIPAQAQAPEACGIGVKVTQAPERGGFNVGIILNGTELNPNAVYEVGSDDNRIRSTITFGDNPVANNVFRISDYQAAVDQRVTVLRVINRECNVAVEGLPACTICSRNVEYNPNSPIVTPEQEAEDREILLPDNIPNPADTALIRNTRDLCQQAGPLTDECLKCEEGEVWTALGCIPTSAEGLVRNLFRISLGIAGGVALLFILFGAFSISVSAGNPESVQKGKEMVTSAIIGLVFIIFSTIILQWIGVSILAIPGF